MQKIGNILPWGGRATLQYGGVGMRDAARHVATNSMTEHHNRLYRILQVCYRGVAHRYTLLGLLTLIAAASFGQSLTVTGAVTESANGTPIEFASVVVYPSNDTAQVVKGVVCDLKGGYTFTLPEGEYRLVAQSLNYAPLQRSITVPRLEKDSTITVDFALTSSNIQIAAAQVEGSNQRVHLNRTEYTFTRDEKKLAHQGLELIAQMPRLTTDPQTDRLTTQTGKEVTILINGVKATQEELQAIPTDKIIRADFYDLPPARYAGVGALVDVKTKRLDNGWSLGFNAGHAVTTGFGNDYAYFYYNSGNHQLGVTYGVNIRDYRDRKAHQVYEYTLKGIGYRDSTYSHDHFGYNTHSPKVRYAYNGARNLFKVEIEPHYLHYFSYDQTTRHYTHGATVDLQTGKSMRRDYEWRPSIDLYYEHRYDEERRLSANLVGIYYDFRKAQSRDLQSDDNSSSFHELQRQKNRKESIIGEVAYSAPLAKEHEWNTGYKAEAWWLQANITNSLGQGDYQSWGLDHRAYFELQGPIAKGLTYNANIGLRHRLNRYTHTKENLWFVTPSVTLRYSHGIHSLRLRSEYEPNTPLLSQLSDNVSRINENIISSGNPHLKTGGYYGIAGDYSINTRYLNAEVEGYAQFQTNYIKQIASVDEPNNRIVIQSENLKFNQILGGYIDLSVFPLGNRFLELSGFCQARFTHIDARQVQLKRQSEISGLVQVSLNFAALESLPKAWQGLSCFYYHNFPGWMQDGIYLNLGENMQAADISYRWGNWKFSARMLWILGPSHYETKTDTDNSPLDYRSETNIYDNTRMMVFSVSWDFRSGKQHEIRQQLQNSDGEGAAL